MKALILGGSGMLGHKLWQEFASRFDTYVTFRDDFASYSRYGIFDASQSRCLLPVNQISSFEETIGDLRPDVVINCIGIVKQSEEARDAIISREVNSTFPHRIADYCRAVNSRLIHISTDCVFSGSKGNYVEDDLADAEDIYGRTKLQGEVSGPGCITIRTSMIGRELHSTNGLIEWFLSQQGKSVPGYTRAIFSGLTTMALSRLLARVIQDHQDLTGIWHVASEPISKFDLLHLVREIYGLDIELYPDREIEVDRSLNAARFNDETGYVVPKWQEMIEEMHQDPTPYSTLRRAYADR
jgi:dTDP-4-dehydrorhamnose reductase